MLNSEPDSLLPVPVRDELPTNQRRSVRRTAEGRQNRLTTDSCGWEQFNTSVPNMGAHMKPTMLYSFLLGFLAALLLAILMDSLVLVLDRLLVERIKECTDRVNATD